MVIINDITNCDIPVANISHISTEIETIYFHKKYLYNLIQNYLWNANKSIKAAPWDDINFRFYFRTEVVYPTDYVFFFLEFLYFYKYL